MDWSAYRGVREFQAVVLESIKNTLKDLEVPDPVINLVVDYYRAVDNSDFLLKEIQWAEEELRSYSRNFEEVD